MAICRSCGAAIPDGAAFCTNCGTPVASPPKPQSPSPEESTVSAFLDSAPPANQQPRQEPFPPANQPPRQEPFPPASQPPRQEPFPPASQPPRQEPFPPASQPPRQEPFPPASQPPRQEPFRPQPVVSKSPDWKEPAAGKKSKKKLLLIIGGVVLLAALVLGILLLTGALGGGPDLEGVWILRDPGNSGLNAGDIVLDIQADGIGTATIKGKSSPLTWTKNSITINDITDKMKLDGEDLIVEEGGGSYVFRREGAEEEASAAPAGAFSSAFEPAEEETAPAEPAMEETATEAPAVEAPATEAPATPMPEEPPVNKDGDGPYWNLPPFDYASGKTFPFGPWGGVYVYNGYFFRTYFQLNEDYTCSRTIYRDGKVVTDEKGVFEYDGSKVKLFMNGDRSTWTEYAIDGEMMVNNNHEFFRQDPGGLIGAWVGDYYYNNKHIHTTYILRSDGTYSEVTFRDDEKVTDNDGTWTFDGSTLKLKAKDTPNITTPFTYVDDVLINNNYKYWRS